MKKIIKKILRESDFEWVKDVPNYKEYEPCEVIDFIDEGDVVYLTGLAYYTDDSDDLEQIEVHFNGDRGVVRKKESDDIVKYFDVTMDKPFFDNPEYTQDVSFYCDEEFPDPNKIKIRLEPGAVFGKDLNESAGISFPVRKWSDIIYNEIMSNPQEKTRLIIDGYDYPEAFEEFQVDYFVIDYHPTITGYGHDYSGYDDDGNYIVVFYIQPVLVQGGHKFNLKTALNHELKHAYQDYKRITKGYPSIDDTKESKTLYTGDFITYLNNRGTNGPLKRVLKDYYYLTDLESTAYLENVYDENPEYEKAIRRILKQDYSKIKSHPDLDSDWYMVKTTFNIPMLNKFSNPRDFIDKSDDILKRRAEKVIKKINKMKYVHGKL